MIEFDQLSDEQIIRARAYWATLASLEGTTTRDALNQTNRKYTVDRLTEVTNEARRRGLIKEVEDASSDAT